MPITTETSQEPIPGYRIVERIGAGGYGEVWKAEAPGGLVKALKFVYGRLDEERAARELKSLERIKDVRHPFLLSLERIEIADGRLMIVTELAEGSLKDRFDQVVAEGKSGLDREELLTYMRDAADVLDYMLDSHSLQHLDIKPENLLLVGGRIKVADFGLVKKLQDVTASLLGGLTPLYAPPELFEGRPSAWSDQYSLAIVYLEMLTGTLPFAGRTAAQLAKQHMHASPKLGTLPLAEQPVLRRALAKRPQDRYASCREFVQALMTAQSGSVPDAGVSSSPGGYSDGAATQPHSAGPRPSAGRRTDDAGRTKPGKPRLHVPVTRSESCVDAGPVEVQPTTPLLRPTLWIGLGGAGARVLVEMHSQQRRRLGADRLPPCWQYLVVDTDANELARLGSAIDDAASPVDGVLPMPLRKPQSYKERGRNPARWLSRRWLYHIPKVPATNGLRPLGCLAFVDHVEAFEVRVSEILRHITDADVLKQSESAVGWPMDDAVPQIIVVAGLGGGTGGGMLVEAASSLRRLLHADGHPGGKVQSVVFHASPRTPQERELATVSSYATLVEIHHAQQGPIGERAFDSVYVHDFGSALTADEFSAAIQRLATSLAVESTTVAGRLKGIAQASDDKEAGGDTIAVRTAGLCAIGPQHGTLVEAMARRLAGSVVQSWLTGDAPEPSQDSSLRERVTRTATASVSTRHAEGAETEIGRWVQNCCDKLELDQQKIANQYATAAAEALEDTIDAFLQDQVTKIVEDESATGGVLDWLAGVQQLLDRLFGRDPDETDMSLSREPGLLDVHLDRVRGRFVDEICAAFAAELLVAATQPEWRVAGAHSLVQFTRVGLRRISDLVRDSQQAAASQEAEARCALKMTEAPATKGKRKPLSRHAAQEYLLQLAQCCWRKYQAQYVVDTYAAIDGALADIHDELVNVSRELRAVHDTVDPPALAEVESGNDAYIQSSEKFLFDNMLPMAAELEAVVHRSLSDMGQEGAWVGLIQQHSNGRGVLCDMLLSTSRRIVAHTLEKNDLIESVTAASPDAMTERIMEWFGRAERHPESWGGKRRRYLIVPDANRVGPWLEAYYGHEHNLPSVVEGTIPEIVFGAEFGAIPISRVAVSIIGGRSDRVEYANRLLCRSDVEYPPLPDEELPTDQPARSG